MGHSAATLTTFLRAGVTTANKIRVRDRIVALILLVLLLRIETTRTWARGQSLAFGFCHFLLRFIRRSTYCILGIPTSKVW